MDRALPFLEASRYLLEVVLIVRPVDRALPFLGNLSVPQGAHTGAHILVAITGHINGILKSLKWFKGLFTKYVTLRGGWVGLN